MSGMTVTSRKNSQNRHTARAHLSFHPAPSRIYYSATLPIKNYISDLVEFNEKDAVVAAERSACIRTILFRAVPDNQSGKCRLWETDDEMGLRPVQMHPISTVIANTPTFRLLTEFRRIHQMSALNTAPTSIGKF